MRKKHTGRNIPFGGSLRSLGRCGQTRYISPVYDGRPDGSSVLDLSGRWASHQERVNRFAARAFGRFFFYIFSLSFPPWLYGWPWPRRHRCHQKFSLSRQTRMNNLDRNCPFGCASKWFVRRLQQRARVGPPPENSFFFSVQYRPRSTTGPFFLSLIVFLFFFFFPVSIIDARMAGGCRSAWQECALVVSLEMFNILLERCNAMLKEQLESSNQPATSRLLGEDLQIILPAIKVR